MDSSWGLIVPHLCPSLSKLHVFRELTCKVLTLPWQSLSSSFATLPPSVEDSSIVNGSFPSTRVAIFFPDLTHLWSGKGRECHRSKTMLLAILTSLPAGLRTSLVSGDAMVPSQLFSLKISSFSWHHDATKISLSFYSEASFTSLLNVQSEN